jgi:hypothetical protein
LATGWVTEGFTNWIVPPVRLARPRMTGVCDRSAYLQVGRPADTEHAANEVHTIRRVHGKIERDVLRESLRERSFDAARELIDKVAEVKCGRERKVGEVDIAAEERRFR